ncbi:MAG: tyrosine-type recombinase/integrase, partial [Syntrophaceae bacterium]|nr:tyrosine-type recombinase/integrase [Syntrophaceae bacterium]
APGRKMKTRHNILSCLYKMLRDAVAQEMLLAVPNFPADFSKSKIPDPDWRWIDQETQNLLLENLDDEIAYFIYFLMSHGCRPSEARALQHQDIDEKNMTITFRRTFSDDTLRHIKNKKIRTVPVDEIWLDIYQARRKSDELPGAFVFTYKGKPLKEYHARNKWRYAQRKAGVQINLYSATRHSLASQAAIRVTSLYLIQRFLGHTDSRTTERYSHVNVNSLKAVQRHDNVIRLSSKHKSK